MKIKVVGSELDGWQMEYEDEHGRSQVVSLDAETEQDAVFEASQYHDVGEEEVEVEYI